eukprot:4749965-Prymnesium_polylepis.1
MGGSGGLRAKGSPPTSSLLSQDGCIRLLLLAVAVAFFAALGAAAGQVANAHEHWRALFLCGLAAADPAPVADGFCAHVHDEAKAENAAARGEGDRQHPVRRAPCLCRDWRWARRRWQAWRQRRRRGDDGNVGIDAIRDDDEDR